MVEGFLMVKEPVLNAARIEFIYIRQKRQTRKYPKAQCQNRGLWRELQAEGSSFHGWSSNHRPNCATGPICKRRTFRAFSSSQTDRLHELFFRILRAHSPDLRLLHIRTPFLHDMAHLCTLAETVWICIEKQVNTARAEKQKAHRCLSWSSRALSLLRGWIFGSRSIAPDLLLVIFLCEGARCAPLFFPGPARSDGCFCRRQPTTEDPFFRGKIFGGKLTYGLFLLLSCVRFLGVILVLPRRATARWWWWRRWWDHWRIFARLTRHDIKIIPIHKSLAILLYTFLVQSFCFVWVWYTKETPFRPVDVLRHLASVVVEWTVPWSRCRRPQEAVRAGYLTRRHCTSIYSIKLLHR